MSSIMLCVVSGVLFACEEKSRTVPLDSVYGTSGQKEIKRLSTATDGAGTYVDPAGADLVEIMKLDKKAETCFLVNGKDVASAVKASVAGFAKGPPTATEKEPVWLSVYFGITGSSPPAYLVQSVEIRGNTIRLSYRKGLAVSADIHQYYAYAPLGKLAAGEYTLELFETESKEITKTKVKVAAK